jgi:hypothetical protein
VADRSADKGSNTYADGRLHSQRENNVLAYRGDAVGLQGEKALRDTGQGTKELGDPVISDGRLYERNHDSVLVYDVKAPQWRPTGQSQHDQRVFWSPDWPGAESVRSDGDRPEKNLLTYAV